MKKPKERLLVSIRGPKEARAAVEGGAHIAHVEYPASALEMSYPLNIAAVRKAVPKSVAVAANIGEEQPGIATACQAALGFALAGADIVKLGLARMSLREAKEFGLALVRTVKKRFLDAQCVATLFADERLTKWYIDPIEDGPGLAKHIKADGLLVDIFDKSLGMGLMDYYTPANIKRFVDRCHSKGLEAWLAGSIAKDELPYLWAAGVDVVCIRAAACEKGTGPGRFGQIKAALVKQLVGTVPSR